MGTILLKSLFDPQRDPSLLQEGLHQNFTMVVPDNVLTGPSILSLTHLQMVGVSILSPFGRKSPNLRQTLLGQQKRGSGNHRNYRQCSVSVS